MIRSGNFDRVDIGPLNHRAEIGIDSASVINPAIPALGIKVIDPTPRRFSAADGVIPVSIALAVDVTDGDHLHSSVSEEIGHIPGTLVAGTDKSHTNPIRRSHFSITA